MDFWTAIVCIVGISVFGKVGLNWVKNRRRKVSNKDLANIQALYFRRFLGRIENWSQKSYKNTEIDLDRLGLNQSKKIEAGRSDNEIRIKPQYGQWHQVPFGICSSPHSQRTCQKADA